jgi:DNA repair photolyase
MLNKVKPGSQMYPWVTHTWPVGRGCSHQCSYCYVKTIGGLANGQPKDFYIQGKPDLGQDHTIFVGDCVDLFSEAMDDQDIRAVLHHCRKFPKNRYVFQTKNPERMFGFLGGSLAERPELFNEVPGQYILGTTIETDDRELLAKHSTAPAPVLRANWIGACRDAMFKTFVTIEPIMKFNLQGMKDLLAIAKPSFINIGADSKKNNLPEPNPDELVDLLSTLRNMGFEIREKHNLERLMR